MHAIGDWLLVPGLKCTEMLFVVIVHPFRSGRLKRIFIFQTFEIGKFAYQGLRHRGDGGDASPPFLRVRGIIPPIFRKIVGQIR